MDRPPGVPQVSYWYDDDEHQRWKVAAAYKGQSLKEWIRRALSDEADRQEQERAEAERKRRSH